MREDAERALAAIEDEALRDQDEERLLKRVYGDVGKFSFDGILVRAPAEFIPSRATNATLPLAIVVGQNLEHAAKVPLPSNASVVLTRLDAPGCWTTPAFPPPEHKRTFEQAPRDPREDAPQEAGPEDEIG